MSSVEAPAAPDAAPPSGSSRLLCGWGRTSPSSAWLARPRDAEQLGELLRGASASGGAIPRGAGRSYGDPAQNAGGTVLDMRGLAGVRNIDAERGEVRVGAGTSFAELLSRLAAAGLTLPVAPGTRHLTVGGAIPPHVHGKNHAHAGSVGRHVVSFALCTPADGLLEVSESDRRDLFGATLGGMGLTGAIVEATLRTVPMRVPYAFADVERVGSIEQAIGLIETGSHTHAIAWLDLLARGSRFTRAIVTRSQEGPEPTDRSRLSADPRPRLSVPGGFPGGLLRPATVRAFNSALWRRTPRRVSGRPLRIDEQLFPLDRVADWNRLYGRDGLIQYQFAVPRGQERTLRSVLELLVAARVPMYLAALKRFGRAGEGLLSFPVEGWTLAIDIPGGAPGLAATLDRADELVASVAGRVYLAKDARMRPSALEAMYPQLPRFRELRARIDPADVLRSDMSRRLGLSE
jgi:decaprenylphospho-beta-D-ribofuranose 2-oxidase